jgi:hypothetical protein
MAKRNLESGGEGWRKLEQGSESRSESDALASELNAALAKYADIEPRAGLEQRILAHLQAEPKNAPDRTWWRLSAAAVVLAVIIVMVSLTWRPAQPVHHAVANHPAAMPVPEETTKRIVSNVVRNSPKSGASSRTTRTRRSSPAVVAATEPKLDQFPSPQPLSAEEMALARYVQSFPKEATLIAQAQEESELEIEKEMNDAGSQTRTSGSIQQER